MYKTFDLTKDVRYTEKFVYEYMPISGSVFESGTFSAENKTFVRQYPNQIFSGSDSGSFFLTYYDRAKTNSEAVELFDMTFGFSISSSLYTSAFNQDAKNRMYKQFAEKCLGDEDERFSIGGTYYDELYFIYLKRNVFHDQIRKGYNTFYTVYSNATGTGSVDKYPFTDLNGRSTHYEGKGGTYQYLTCPSGSGYAGFVFYDAGIIALIPSGAFGFWDGYADYSGSARWDETIATGTIDQIVASCNDKWDTNGYTHPFTFYAEEAMQSALYVCNAGLGEFNYSSNPTYVDAEGRIIMTSGSKPTKAASYITTIALYNDNNELLGTAKLSEPFKNDADTSENFTVRINY